MSLSMFLGYCFPAVAGGEELSNYGFGSQVAGRSLLESRSPDRKLSDRQLPHSNPGNQNPGQGKQTHPCAVPVNLRSGKPSILLGRFEDEPYVVAVPGRDRRQLAALRACVPDAFILPSRRGSYIHVASFADRTSATYLSQHLRQLGFDARVAYFE
ncbi:MAG: hypothetical protein HC857_06355 [Synechococcales cyanobacterium RU_4_20]|nr:hypothetical protein [Synechococcales cyanobacterium RU_4_20]